ncbi:MAG TPA: PASTA domain-containing protein, partial [Verrucomicrobiae bacterium]|nr:PASTA domain-containing protein [Verrucomicrobiae bacterium]
MTRITVPNVINQQIAIAQKTLEGLGLNVGVQEIRLRDRSMPGSVVNQQPAAGTQVATGAMVMLTVKREGDPIQQMAPDDLQQNKAPNLNDPGAAEPNQQYQVPPEQRRGETAKDDDAAWWPLLNGVVYAQSNANTPVGQLGINAATGQPGEVPREDLITVFAPSERVRIAIGRSNTPYFSVDADAWAPLVSDNVLDGREGLTVKLRKGWIDPSAEAESWGAASPHAQFLWFRDPSGGLVTAQAIFDNAGEPQIAEEVTFDSIIHLATDTEQSNEESVNWVLMRDARAAVYHPLDQRAVPLALPNPPKFR